MAHPGRSRQRTPGPARQARLPRAARHGRDPRLGSATRARPRSAAAQAAGEVQDRFWAEAQARRSSSSCRASMRPARTARSSKVMEAFNPQGCAVTAFKVPTAEELAHDFLWRIHKADPGKGEIGIFNRSHYEDVLVVRVHDLVPKAVWSKRYDQINDVRADCSPTTGTTIVKFFLSIDRDEQRGALPGALRRPDQALEVLDGRPRGAQALGRLPGRVRRGARRRPRPTRRPWYVIPANRKWFRNLAVSTILADTDRGPAAGLSAGRRGRAGGPRHRVAARRTSAAEKRPEDPADEVLPQLAR